MKVIWLGCWLLGRIWGDESYNLKVERDLVEYVGESLVVCGYDMVIVDLCNEFMGYVGVIICEILGEVSGVSDFCSDGKVYLGYC